MCFVFLPESSVQNVLKHESHAYRDPKLSCVFNQTATFSNKQYLIV